MGIARLFSDVLRQLEQYGTGPLFFGHAKGLAHRGRDRIAVYNLFRHLADPLEQADNVDDLELTLFGFLDRLLARNHDQRHSAQLRVGRRRGEIRSAGAERGHANTGLAGQAAVCGCHKAGTLFMARQDQLDRGIPQRFDHVQVLFARDGKDMLHPLGFQSPNKQI
jgi:hypothetical protein